MRIVSWLAAAGLVMGTAGCVETTGYPATYGYSPGYSSGYNTGYGYQGYSNNYRSQPSYSYTPQVVTQTRYVAVPVAQPRPSSWGMRDSDGDGVPDRYQRRQY